MPKILKKLFIFSFAFIILFTIPTKVQASEDLTIPRWRVHAELLQNGDLHIIEDLTYQFNNDFNGVFREIVLDGTAGISDIKIEEITGASYAPYAQVEKAKKGDHGVFIVENKDNSIIIQIFSPSEDEEKTFRIGYVVKDVAVRYNDIGELYYKFLGDENQTPIDSFVVELGLPGRDVNHDVKIFAHGPLNGQIEKKNDSTFLLRVGDVPPKTFIEGRVVFPKEFIPLSTNVIHQDNYENILEEEASYARDLEEKAQRKTRLNNTLGYASLISTVSGMFILLFFLILFRREKHGLQDYDNTTLPEDCTPGVASYLTRSLVSTDTIMATFLDLFRKGYISLEKNIRDKNKPNKEEDYIIHKIKDGDDKLLEHERHFINWFINEIGDGSKVTTKKIKKFNKNYSNKSHTLYDSWIKKIKEDAIALGHFDKSKSKYGILFLALFVPLLALGIITLVYENLWGIGSLVVAGFFLIYGISLFHRRSDYGYEQYKRWLSFKKYMKNNKDLATSGNIEENSNNIFLIYALGLGVNKSLHDKDNVDLQYHENDFYYNNNWVFWYFIFANNSNNSLTKSIDQSWSGSSDSGGSFTGGGFTGGGGAGGGGAGGF